MIGIERLRRVAQLWSRLPAFRVVAETQHLPTASRELRVTASALSRTVGLLEEEVGIPLFRRVGRRIELNEHGEKMLAAVRDAMRVVHEGLVGLEAAQLSGPVRVSSPGTLASAYVVPALQILREEHGGLVPHLSNASLAELAELLLRGDLDVAFVSHRIDHDRLHTEHLGSMASWVYCGPGHPLFRRRRVALEQVLEHAFVAPLPDPTGRTPEGWPPEVERRVALHITHLHVGVEVCARGELLAVLPEDIAAAAVDLHRLPLDVVQPTEVLAIRRPTLGPAGRAEAVVAAVRRVMG